jgi:hypothetical protein
MNDFQDKILEKLSEHSVLLATISSDISGLRRDDDFHMDKIKNLEGRIQFLERMTFMGFVIIVIMAVKLGLGYLLNLKP